MGRMYRGSTRLLEWVGRIDTDPADSNETVLQKRLAVLLCVGTLPLTALWSAITASHSQTIHRPSIPGQTPRMAGAHEFILQLPEGYDTEIEERGMNLSGGQRQRIAIARALLLNPRILIFDEAPSASNPKSEKAIQENMRHIVSGRTVVIVAHRRSALRACSRIVRIEHGRALELAADQDMAD